MTPVPHPHPIPTFTLCSGISHNPSHQDSILLIPWFWATRRHALVNKIQKWRGTSFELELQKTLHFFFSLSLSQTPAQPQVQSSLLADETHMDQSVPLSQPTANHDLKAEPPSWPVSDHRCTMLSLDQPRPEEPPSRSQPKPLNLGVICYIGKDNWHLPTLSLIFLSSIMKIGIIKFTS